ncbi:MAG: HD domain-containing phosphohydrolase, partial [Thermodesulfobacteriota bacterium]
LYIQIFNKATRKFYLRKVSQENTVFTSGLKEILEKRRLASVFIREQDYRNYLEYQESVKSTLAFTHQKIRDTKRLLLYGKAVEAVNEILSDPADNKNVTAAVDLVDDLFKAIVDDPVTYQDLFKLFKRDTTIFNHCANVCLLTVSFGVYLGLKQDAVKVLGLGAMFHDVGMNRVDHRILDKSGPLTRFEWEEIKKHPERGYALLKSSLAVPVPALRIILEHHEKPDGTGYPRGLKEEGISQLARLCQIVDKYDGMTTRKPYRESFSAAEALKRIYFEESSEKYQKVIRRFIEFLGGK